MKIVVYINSLYNVNSFDMLKFAEYYAKHKIS